MATRVFLCPHTGQQVQGWFADDGSEDAGGETYEGVSCFDELGWLVGALGMFSYAVLRRPASCFGR